MKSLKKFFEMYTGLSNLLGSRLDAAEQLVIVMLTAPLGFVIGAAVTVLFMPLRLVRGILRKIRRKRLPA